jgi:hypothetical protein
MKQVTWSGQSKHCRVREELTTAKISASVVYRQLDRLCPTSGWRVKTVNDCIDAGHGRLPHVQPVVVNWCDYAAVHH